MVDDREIQSDKIQDNETWNTCPECLKNWKDIVPIPGLLHRTRLCGVCIKKGKDNGKSH